MGRAAQVAIGLYIAWLIIFVVLQGSASTSTRDFANLWGALLIFGPMGAIVVLTVAVWVERRLKRR